MESSERGYRKVEDDLVIQSLHPIVLEERVETCRIDYRAKKGKFPNAVILSNEARVVMHNFKLLDNSYSVSAGKRRDVLFTREVKLYVYGLVELIGGKRLEVKEKFSSSPETLYLGRAN